MAEQLQSLLQKIHDEAITKADVAGKKRIDEADAQAKNIVANAEKRAAAIIASAEQKSAQFSDNGRKALEHAARDVLIYLRQAIQRTFDSLIKRAVPELIPVNVVQEILIKLASDAFHQNRTADGVRVFVSEKDLKTLTDFFMHRFHKELKQGAELHPMPSIKSGFRICLADKDIQYDYTDDVLVQVLGSLINPVLDDILKKAASTPAPPPGK